MARWTRPQTPQTPQAQYGATQTPAAAQIRDRVAKETPKLLKDLYARWALATDWRGFKRGLDAARRGAPAGCVRILARVDSQADWSDVWTKAGKQDGQPWLRIAPMYADEVPGGDRKAMHFTAMLKADDLLRLTRELPQVTWEIALPLRASETVAHGESPGRFGNERTEDALKPTSVLRANPPANPRAPLDEASKLDSAIAVVDFGCPFLNMRFADRKGGTRVAALWDQSDDGQRSVAPWWHLPHDAGYGRELGGAAMQRICAEVRGEPTPEAGAAVKASGQTAAGYAAMASSRLPADEAAAYRSLDYLIAYDDPRRRVWHATHGAHVLDVAGGSHDPLAATRGGDAARLDGGREASDPAGDAPLVFVQLPALTAADSSGGSLGAQLLDAVRYVLARCKSVAPIVVNISYGSFAGPHDGSSMIERALDELLEIRRHNFAIVLGAGNARQAGCHVRRTARKDRSALLRFVLDAGDTTDTFVELWYPRPADDSPLLQVRVRTAGRDWSDWVQRGQRADLVDPATGDLVALLQHEHCVPGSATKALVLLALAPTAHALDDDGALADAGVWEMEVALYPTPKPGPDVCFDAYVERDDPGEGGGGAQPCFIGIDRDDERDTLSSIATGQFTIAAGAYRISDSSAAEYSSLGPLPGTTAGTTAGKTAGKTAGRPLVYAAAEEDALQPNIAAAAVRSADVHRMNGTSVAAPVLARQLYNWLLTPHAVQRRFNKAGVLTSDGWTAVLQALARKPGGFVREPPP